MNNKTKTNCKLKQEDEVIVMTGRYAGKTGKIQLVNRKKGKIKIPSINMVKKHRKPTQEKQSGEVVEIPSYIDISNVMLLCPSCKKGVRVRIERPLGKKKRRVCHRCGHSFDK